jgi:hypothetical protein
MDIELETASFRQHVDYNGWSGDYAGNTPTGRQQPAESRERGSSSHLLTANHGFVVETLGSTQPKPDPCPHCGGSRYSVNTWFCEFQPEEVTPMTDTGCGCNWCLINRWATPGKGRPRIHCGKPACVKEDRKIRNQRSYRQRKEAIA